MAKEAQVFQNPQHFICRVVMNVFATVVFLFIYFLLHETMWRFSESRDLFLRWGLSLSVS